MTGFQNAYDVDRVAGFVPVHVITLIPDHQRLVVTGIVWSEQVQQRLALLLNLIQRVTVVLQSQAELP